MSGKRVSALTFNSLIFSSKQTQYGQPLNPSQGFGKCPTNNDYAGSPVGDNHTYIGDGWQRGNQNSAAGQSGNFGGYHYHGETNGNLQINPSGIYETGSLRGAKQSSNGFHQNHSVMGWESSRNELQNNSVYGNVNFRGYGANTEQSVNMQNQGGRYWEGPTEVRQNQNDLNLQRFPESQGSLNENYLQNNCQLQQNQSGQLCSFSSQYQQNPHNIVNANSYGQVAATSNLEGESAEASETSSNNAMVEALDGFCEEGNVQEAVEVLGLMEKQGVHVDLPRILQLMKACGETKALQEAKTVHEYLQRLLSEQRRIRAERLVGLNYESAAIVAAVFYLTFVFTKSGAVEAILLTGSRLEQWRQEPEATKAVCSIFGLVPGEDRLFANTILLRLAHAFQFGDKDIRLSVVRIFLTYVRYDRNKKHRKQKRRTFLYGGVHNHAELLRRVKIVFDTGDVESRALALVLFGCWANFAKDSAEIRYIILSSMVSSTFLEVKASLFAASCFCELANDFASIVLEMLVNMMASPETLPCVRLAGARALTRMVCSYSVSNRAFKTGVKLVTDSSDEKFIITMLVSLSKLVSRATPFISEQVDLLISYLRLENTGQLRVTSLRCLHLIFVKEGCCSPVNMHVIKTLFSILDENELPSVMPFRALQILHKILLYTLANLPSFEMLDFAQLLAILEKASKSPTTSKSIVALRVLTDMSTKLWARTRSECFTVCSSPLPSWVISLIMERLSSLLKLLLDPCQTSSRPVQEIKSLLNLILQLVEEHPHLCAMVLDEISLIIKYIANLNEDVVANKQIGTSESGQKCKVFRFKILSTIHRFVAACLQNLSEAGAITDDVFDKVKLLIENLHHGRVFDCYTHTIYSLLLHSHLFGKIDACLIEHPFKHELATLGHAGKMLLERDNWNAYKAGIYAACQGAWITATFIFAQLMTRVQSDSCCCWFKSLFQFSYSELKVQLNLSPKQRSILVGSLDMYELAFLKDYLGELRQVTEGNNSEPNYRDVLVEACCNLSSSIKTLETVAVSRKEFCFQRWFFSLRAKVLGTAGEIVELWDTSDEEKIRNINEIENIALANLKRLQIISQLSFRVKRLAEELDLISSTFIGIDSESSKILATLALNCSILAFTTGFPLFFPNLPDYKNLRICDHDSEQNFSSEILLQDLLGRLLHIDHEISMNLCLLLDDGEHPRNCFHMQSRNQILKSAHEVRDTLDMITYAVSTVVRLRSETNKMQNEEFISHVTKNGMQLLLDIIKKWLQIPFQIPKHFFKIRPLVGSELFAFNADTDTRSQKSKITVLAGSHLSLNLCLQLRNTPPDFPLRLAKSYCILHCTVSNDVENSEQKEWDCTPWESQDMVEMNDKLFQYVTECAKKTNYGKRFREYDMDGEQVVNELVCFEPNVKGLGFSTCVLEVSHFPVGSYRVKWYSCCIDNQGSYWSLMPLNSGPVFTVKQQSHVISSCA
ncbi:hypothetical protein CCACVL1_13200 [Corchorus capsularis]|uniref:Armadillo-like helical n=1 Tax=Corchorus capsularis TaxID=210143 RepID=A0A1R3IBR4_COCAP|nr:hypothetical protein CCACVL1_13200 [Corchorus capsularis]